VQTFPCALKGCAKFELVPVKCSKCKLTFCLGHRHADDHKCSFNESKKDDKTANLLTKKPSGKEILEAAKKRVGSVSSSSRAGPARKNEQYLKIAQLKFKAVVNFILQLNFLD
jgi:hypothetical protein